MSTCSNCQGQKYTCYSTVAHIELAYQFLTEFLILLNSRSFLLGQLRHQRPCLKDKRCNHKIAICNGNAKTIKSYKKQQKWHEMNIKKYFFSKQNRHWTVMYLFQWKLPSYTFTAPTRDLKSFYVMPRIWLTSGRASEEK